MQQDAPRLEAAADAIPHVRLLTIYWIFFQIGAFSFGGGLTAWLYREVVESRKLLSEADFLGGLTLAQVMPGINMTNLSVYVGQRLRGRAGAITAIVALLSAPFFAILVFGTVYASLRAIPALRYILDGMACSAVGLVLSMGVRAVRATRMENVQLAITVIVAVAIGILRLPMIPVILVLAPISIALVWPWGSSEDA